MRVVLAHRPAADVAYRRQLRKQPVALGLQWLLVTIRPIITSRWHLAVNTQSNNDRGSPELAGRM